MSEDDEGTPAFSSIPSYIVGANTHDVAAGDSSLAETLLDVGAIGGGVWAGAAIGSAVPVVGTIVGGVVGGIAGMLVSPTKSNFAEASLIATANTFYNSGAAIANIALDDDIEYETAQSWMDEYDSDLSAYYTENKGLVDTASFIGGSFIPGLGALAVYNKTTKALNLAKLGAVGKNTEAATGLLVPMQQQFLNLATKELASTTAAVSFRNRNLLKSVAAGVGEQAIQAAIFETAALVTMTQAPMLEDLDSSDLAENILWGTVLGAGIGGLFEVAITYGKVSKGLKLAEGVNRPFEATEELSAGATSSEKIINWYDNKFRTPEVPLAGEADVAERLTKLRSAKFSYLEDSAAIEMQRITNQDPVLANYLNVTLKQAESTEAVAHTVLGLKEASRFADVSPALKEVTKIRARINRGEKLAAKEFDLLDVNHEVSYKVFGEDAGAIKSNAPNSISIQDTLKKGQKIKITKSKVTAGGKSWSFGVGVKKDWTVLGTSVHEAQARNLWAMSIKRLPENFTLGTYDLPLISRAYKDSATATGKLQYKIKGLEGKMVNITEREQLLDILESHGEAASMQLLEQSVKGNAIVDTVTKDRRIAEAIGVELKTMSKEEQQLFDIAKRRLTSEDIGMILNRRTKKLDGDGVNTTNRESDLFAMESYAQEYAARLGTTRAGVVADEVLLNPQHMRLVYDSTLNGKAVDQNTLDAMTHIRQQQKIYTQETDLAAAPILGDLVEQFPEISDRAILGASTTGSGSTAISPANGAFGSLAMLTERVGQVTNRVKTAKINALKDSVEPTLFKLGTDVEATAEVSSIMNRIRNTPEKYVLTEDGSSIVLRGNASYLKAVQAGDTKARPYVKIDPSAADEIPVTSQLARDILGQHVAVSGKRANLRKPLTATKRGMDTIDPDTLYFPPPNEKLYPFKAFVVDDSISGGGHMKMIHAATEDKLGQLISKVPKSLTVVTKSQSERWHRALGEFKLDETISESYIDVALQRSGVASNYFPETDAEKIVQDLMAWHTNQEVSLVREAVGAKYYKQFAELKRLGEGHTDLATSRTDYSSLSRRAAEDIDNPYMSYIRTALDIPNTAKIPARVFQNWLDEKASQVWNTVTDATSKTKSVEDLDAINDMWTKAGIKTAYYDGVTAALADHVADKGALNTLVGRANAILASITLRPDALNAVNNTVGSAVLSVPQTQYIIKALQAGDTAAVGDLAKLAHIKVPGTDDTVFSTTKLFSNAMRNFFAKDTQHLRKTYLDNGWTTRHMAEIQTIHDDLKISEVFSTADLNGKITNSYNRLMKLFDKAEIVSGNKLAEEFTRFLSADVMRQITDVGVKHGVITAGEAGAYINTFVNKANGNYLASQRPMMFHGPVGQAVGLFQTYQVNFLQQTLSHISRGESRAAGMIMGMQGTIYGMNGLPAFQAVNTHLIGSMAGNTDNKDIYSTLYAAADKDVADWFMYGAGSNMLGLLHPDLKTNLYTRGDINPRQITIVPTKFEQLPIVGASTKFFTNLKTMYNRASAGGSSWDVLLQGIEHNGLSRPLSGIGQILEASTNTAGLSYSTSKTGSLIATNELLSLANVARVLGAKPLDEAITTDKSFRSMVYQAKKSDQLRTLGSAIRSKVIGNRTLTREDSLEFLSDYMKVGGKQAGFNRFLMSVMKSANTARANTIIRDLKSPEAARMQTMLDGGELLDFTNVDRL